MTLPIGAKKRLSSKLLNLNITMIFTREEAKKIDAYVKTLAEELPDGYRLSRHSFMRDVILREINK